MRLTSYEARHILHWAGYTTDDSMHWGNGQVLLPFESELLKKLNEINDEIELELPEVNLIYFWGISYLKDGIMFMGEDIMILNKMLNYYKSLENKNDDIKSKIKHIEGLLKNSE